MCGARHRAHTAGPGPRHARLPGRVGQHASTAIGVRARSRRVWSAATPRIPAARCAAAVGWAAGVAIATVRWASPVRLAARSRRAIGRLRAAHRPVRATPGAVGARELPRLTQAAWITARVAGTTVGSRAADRAGGTTAASVRARELTRPAQRAGIATRVGGTPVGAGTADRPQGATAAPILASEVTLVTQPAGIAARIPRTPVETGAANRAVRATRRPVGTRKVARLTSRTGTCRLRRCARFSIGTAVRRFFVTARVSGTAHGARRTTIAVAAFDRIILRALRLGRGSAGSHERERKHTRRHPIRTTYGAPRTAHDHLALHPPLGPTHKPAPIDTQEPVARQRTAGRMGLRFAD